MADTTTTTPDTDNPTGADAPTTQLETGKTFTQDELDVIIADRLERQKKKLLKEKQDADDAAATKQLEEAAEWQKLAEKRQKQLEDRDGRLAELETQAALSDKYGKALESYVTKLSEGLPESILTLLSGMDQAARLEWLTANRDQFVKSEPETPQQQQQQPRKPLPQTPRPAEPVTVTDDERRKKAARTF